MWEKMGVGLQDLLPSFGGFTCTDATEEVLWSYDYNRKTQF